jgi:hypothetical protein
LQEFRHVLERRLLVHVRCRLLALLQVDDSAAQVLQLRYL